jgi:hypothetical protein
LSSLPSVRAVPSISSTYRTADQAVGSRSSRRRKASPRNLKLNDASGVTDEGLQNVIQGVYPVKPAVRTDIGEEPLTIMGNEGTGIVEGLEEDGNVETLFKVGDRGELRSLI